MRWVKASVLMLFFTSLATATSFFGFKRDVLDSLSRLCGSIEVYLQIGSYRTARELAAATLKSSYREIDAQFSFDNLTEPTPRDPKQALLKASCSVSGRSASSFEIYVYSNRELIRWLARRFAQWFAVFCGLSLIFSFGLQAASRVVLDQVNSTLAVRLGIQARKDTRPNWIATWLDGVPALAEASQKTKGLIHRLDQEIARSSELELAVERRRIFSKYMHDVRSPIGALKILFQKKAATFSPEENAMVGQIITRLEEIPGDVLDGEKQARLVAQGHLQIQDARAVFDHVGRRLALRLENDCQLEINNEVSTTKTRHRISVGSLDIDRILSNLVENAQQAGATKVSIYALNDDRTLTFEVIDNGPGGLSLSMPSPQRKTKGFGLGLEIVKEIVERGQARIIIESPEGNGTRIKVAFPFINEEPVDQL